MSKYARIINGIAVDVSENPAEHFHQALAAEFVPVPDDVCPGWVIVDGLWAAPPEHAPTPEPAPSAVKVSPIEFKMLFTAAERLHLKNMRGTDAVIDDWLEILDDPRLAAVDLSLKSTLDAVDYALARLHEAGIVADIAARRYEIISGVVT